MVSVTSPQGSLVVKAKLLPGIMPGVIYIPFGMGHQNYGRYAENIGVNPYQILEEDYDFLNGTPSLTSTKVVIKRTQKAKQKEYA